MEEGGGTTYTEEHERREGLGRSGHLQGGVGTERRGRGTTYKYQKRRETGAKEQPIVNLIMDGNEATT